MWNDQLAGVIFRPFPHPSPLPEREGTTPPSPFRGEELTPFGAKDLTPFSLGEKGWG